MGDRAKTGGDGIAQNIAAKVVGGVSARWGVVFRPISVRARVHAAIPWCGTAVKSRRRTGARCAFDVFWTLIFVTILDQVMPFVLRADKIGARAAFLSPMRSLIGANGLRPA